MNKFNLSRKNCATIFRQNIFDYFNFIYPQFNLYMYYINTFYLITYQSILKRALCLIENGNYISLY